MRFVVCGEALVDMLPAEVVSPQETRWTALAGGGPMNSAVALKRLGRDVQFLGRLGGDAFGRQIEGWLDANNVGTELAVRTPDPTSMAVVSLDDEGKAQYTFHFDGTSNFGWQASEFPTLTDEDWLHFGSIAAVVGPGSKALRNFVAGTRAAVSYDINVRPTVQPDRSAYFDAVADLMAAVGSGGGIVKASDEDINWLVDDDDPLSYAETWAAEYGLSMFVVTLGADGVVKPRCCTTRSKVFTAEALRWYQDQTFGTIEWYRAWNIRNRVEGSYGIIKNLSLMNYGRDYHHFTGIARESLAAGFALAAHNMHMIRTWQAQQAELERRLTRHERRHLPPAQPTETMPPRPKPPVVRPIFPKGLPELGSDPPDS